MTPMTGADRGVNQTTGRRAWHADIDRGQSLQLCGLTPRDVVLASAVDDDDLAPGTVAGEDAADDL